MSIQLLLNWNVGSGGRAYPATQQEYLTGSGNGGGGGATISAGIGYAFADGYHYFNLAPGQYTIDIQGAEGSGTSHGYGAIITANLIVKVQTRFVAIVGNPGTSSYGGGGMSALAMRNAATDTYTTAIPVLVAGGGAGGYSTLHNQVDGGDTNWNPTTRRGVTTGGYDGGGNYDAGAAFYNVYSPAYYSNNAGTQGSVSAQHWVWGSRGGIQGACGGIQGGFGGGGGGCPAGGGGYYGGKAGGDTPGGSPGGGGTSYRLSEDNETAYISTWSDVGLNGSGRNTTGGTSGGKLTITYSAPYVPPAPGIASNVSVVAAGKSVGISLRTATAPSGSATVPYTITGNISSSDITIALTGSITTTNNIGNLIIGTVAAPAGANARSFPNNVPRIGGSVVVTPISSSNSTVVYTSFNNQKLRTQSNQEIIIGRSLLYGKVNGYSESTTAILVKDKDRVKIVNQLGVANVTTSLDPMVYFVMTSVPAVTSIGVKTDRGVGFFEQGTTGYYRAITDQNDPRPIVIPGTAVSGPKQYWY